MPISSANREWKKLNNNFFNTDGFAVIDFETTGLHLDKGDRAVQVAIVHTDLEGNIQNSWSHYINPERPMAAEHIHGITEQMVLDAPHFRELAEGILHRVDNRILVAHNIDFDGLFLTAELNRSGIPYDYRYQPSFCTQQNAVYFLPQLRSHKLIHCLEETGITFGDGKHHDAEDDATATAKLMQYYLKENPELFISLMRSPET